MPMRTLAPPPARVVQIPAPIGGWNARDPLAAMKSTDAVILENVIPGTGGVSVRPGYTTFSTGLGAAVKALLRYNAPGTPSKLFAAAGGKVFDVSNVGGVGAAALSGLVSDDWRSVNFGTPGGNFLIIANGADAPKRFDGSTWADLSLVIASGAQPALTPSKLTSPFVFGSRLWFIEANSLRAWYLGVNQIASSAPPAGNPTDMSATAQALDFSAQCTLGGSLVAMAVWTRDGGQGSDDYAVFLTSAGEVLIYAGTDPSNAATWSRVGVFRLPPPIGTRCIQPAGADLGILTQQGLVPLSSVLPLAGTQAQTQAITDKIKGAFAQAFASASVLPGWEVAQYPRGALVIVNVPRPGGSFGQFVMNAMTSRWCLFKGLPATCWGLSGDNLFFGTADGRVCLFDSGNQDDGAPITATVLPAFSDWKTLGRKRFLLARPLYYGVKGYRPALKVKTDYDADVPPLPQSEVPAAGTPWGSPWGSPWGPPVGPSAQWQGVRGLGQTASVLLQIVTRNPLRLDHIDLTFETGGLL